MPNFCNELGDNTNTSCLCFSDEETVERTLAFSEAIALTATYNLNINEIIITIIISFFLPNFIDVNFLYLHLLLDYYCP